MASSSQKRMRSRTSATALLGIALLASTVVSVWVPDFGVAAAAAESTAEPARPLERLWIDELVAEATQTDGLLALAPLIELRDLTGWLPSTDALRLWRQLAETVPHALAADYARYTALRIAEMNGLDDAAARLLAELGFIDQFSILGPFPNDGMAGFASEFGPELDGVALDATYGGRSGEIGWRTIDGSSETGYVDVGDYVRPTDASVVYLATDLDLPRRTAGTLELAVDGAYRVWVNGTPVAEVRDDLGGSFLRDAIPLELPAGRNQLLIKLASNDGPLGLHLRFVDASRRAVPLRASAAAQAAVVASSATQWPSPTTMHDRLGVDLVADATDAADLAAYALITSRMQPRDPSEPWRAAVDRVAADPAADAAVLLRTSLAVTDHWRRVELLDRARATSRASRASTAWALAHFGELGVGSTEHARDGLREAFGDSEMPLSARLALARTSRDMGFTHVWAAEIDAMVAQYGLLPNLMDEAVSVANTLARGGAESELLQQRWQQRRLDIGAAEAWIERARVLGDHDGIREVVDDLLLRNGNRRATHLAVARHAAAVGDFAGAEAQLGLVAEHVPGDAEPYRELARIRLLAGDSRGAVDALEQVLSRRRQDDAARELLRALQPMADAEYDHWRVAELDVVAAARGLQATAGVDITTIVSQRVVTVHPNGLATTWVQEAHVSHTRSGADSLGSLAIQYSPEAEVIDIRNVAVITPGDTRRTTYEQGDYGPPAGPAAMYFDAHTRALRFPGLASGDVLIYEYTISDVAERNIFDDYFGDVFAVQGAEPMEYVRYAVIAPSDRILETNGDIEGVGAWVRSDVDGGNQMLVFEARSVPRVETEANMPGWSESYAWLSVSTYSTWDALATWYWNLIEDQLVASPAIVAEVERLVDGLDSDNEKVAAIYEYVVRNTRYVGLEFGIHGYKPYRTSEVFDRRFGDCKDTASLIKVMLNLAGIEAHVVLVRTRDLGRVGAFPPSLAVFNHAIAYVPSLGLYLDGTAGFSGSTELPTMDQGASAVIVLDGNGGEFVEIPFSRPTENLDELRVSVDLSSPSLPGTVTMRYEGSSAPGVRRQWEAADQRNASIERTLGQRASGVRVLSSETAGLDSVRLPVSISAQTEGGQWLREQGDATYLPVSPGRTTYVSAYAPTSTRTADVALPVGSVAREEFVWTLRLGCQVEPVVDVALRSEFGSLTTNIAASRGEVRVQSEITFTQAQIDADDYGEFRAWLTAVETALNRHMLLRCIPEEAP